jgi:hypothetical protein
MVDGVLPLTTGRPIFVDFSPVTDFREATCRQYEENTCNRGGYCNFMHLKKISRSVSELMFIFLYVKFCIQDCIQTAGCHTVFFLILEVLTYC